MVMKFLGVLVLAVVILVGEAQAFVCGNGIIEPGEGCDDGNVIDGDGCSAACVFEGCPLTGTWDVSSFGIRASFVEDNFGNLIGIAWSSSSTPTYSLGGSRTGTAVAMLFSGSPLPGTMLDCDTVQITSGIGLTFTRISNAVCGNGTVEAGEECDDGNFSNGDSCSIECTTARCGNGFVDFDEECDDGNENDGDGCSATCRACGNGSIDSGEECDDGNHSNGDGCTATCHVQICGNGVIEPGEGCDDGNLLDGDGCSAACAFEGCPLTGTWDISSFGVLASFIEDNFGNFVGVARSSPSSTPFTLEGSRTGPSVAMLFGGSPLSGAMADCDTIQITSVGFTFIRISDAVCGNGTIEAGEECDDGNFSNGDTCSIECTAARCGNGFVDIGEECDDGNQSDGDGCSATCRACGNGSIDSGEECDDGNRINGDGCTATCHVQICGNGIIEPGEGCDDGNVIDGDGCSAACVFEGCPLTGTWDVSFFGIRASLIEDNVGNLTGVAGSSTATTQFSLGGSRTGTAVAMLFDGSLLAGTMPDCDTIQIAGVGLTFTRISNAVCGNGTVEAGEECDDGNFSNGDSCSTECRLPLCRNGFLDPGEECDDGNTLNGDGCNNNCTRPRCGNGIIDVGTVEQCDDGNRTDGDGCDANCGIPGCPNGVVDLGEECDDGNLMDDDGCARNCTFPACGNGILESAEGCDDANSIDCDFCSGTCAVEVDSDGDAILGACDNCPNAYNPSQHDRDSNGIGDACEGPVTLDTPAGADVAIEYNPGAEPGSPVATITIRYPVVLSSGTTDIEILEAPPGELLGSNFKTSSLGVLLHLETTATVSGTIEVCMGYDDSSLTPEEESALLFLHEEGGTFLDRTSSLDTSANRICAGVTSFSRFALGLKVQKMIDTKAMFVLDNTTAGNDLVTRLKGKLVAAGAAIDLSLTGLTVTLVRDGVAVFTRRVPAGAWVPNKQRRSFKFIDPQGALVSGVTSAKFTWMANGNAKFKLVGKKVDMHGANAAQLHMRIDLGTTTFVGTMTCAPSPGADKTKVRCKS